MASKSKIIHILIVEDNYEDVSIYQKLLKKTEYSAYEFSHAPDANSALQTLHVESYDCILLDQCLPGASGLDLLKVIVNLPCRTPVIMLTGLNDPNLDRAAMENGAFDYIEKSDLNSKLLDRSVRYSIECHKHINHILDITREREETFEKICVKLKKPIKNIIYYCDLFIGQPENAPKGPHIRDIIKDINSCAKKQMHIIDDIIKHEFINSSHPKLQPKEFNLIDLFTKLKSYLSWITIDFEKQKEFKVHADEIKIFKSMRILLNELKKISKKPQVLVRANVKDQTIFIDLLIEESRIKEAKIPDLFVPYSNLKIREGIEPSETSGIDLCYARHVLELHSGKISFYKCSSEGIRWQVSLPLFSNHLPAPQDNNNESPLVSKLQQLWKNHLGKEQKFQHLNK